MSLTYRVTAKEIADIRSLWVQYDQASAEEISRRTTPRRSPPTCRAYYPYKIWPGLSLKRSQIARIITENEGWTAAEVAEYCTCDIRVVSEIIHDLRSLAYDEYSPPPTEVLGSTGAKYVPEHGMFPAEEQVAEQADNWKDEGKPRYDLIKPELLEALADVLTFGADKHGAWDWLDNPKPWGSFFAAALRHLWAWWKGERQDQESNLSHLGHAAACIMFLYTYELKRLGRDDRPNGSK